MDSPSAKRKGIFVSYKSERKKHIEELVIALRAFGFEVWWDKELQPGEYWEDVINHQLSEAALVLACLCERSVGPDVWVKREIDNAIREKKIFPVSIQRGVKLPGVGGRKSAIQHADLSAWNGSPKSEALLRLVSQLDGRVERREGSEIASAVKLLELEFEALKRHTSWPLPEANRDLAADTPGSLVTCLVTHGVGENLRRTSFRIGERFADHKLLPELVLVQPGSVDCGPLERETRQVSGPHERSRWTVTLDSAFAVGRWPVSIGQFNARFDPDLNTAGGIAPLEGEPIDGDPLLPVTGISWSGAKAYVAWLNDLTQREYRLLTEAEWEYCCRAGMKTPTLFAWGDSITSSEANYDWSRSFNGFLKPGHKPTLMPIERKYSIKENDFGICDMLGNVWEWVEDSFSRALQPESVRGAAYVDPTSDQAVIRGGSYRCPPDHLRCAHRASRSKEPGASHIGFRIARSLK